MADYFSGLLFHSKKPHLTPETLKCCHILSLSPMHSSHCMMPFPEANPNQIKSVGPAAGTEPTPGQFGLHGAHGDLQAPSICTPGSRCPWLWVIPGPSHQSISDVRAEPMVTGTFPSSRAGWSPPSQVKSQECPTAASTPCHSPEKIGPILTGPYGQSCLLIPQQAGGRQFNSSPQRAGKATLWQNLPCHHQTCSGDKTNSSSSQLCQLAPCTGCSAGQKSYN